MRVILAAARAYVLSLLVLQNAAFRLYDIIIFYIITECIAPNICPVVLVVCDVSHRTRID